MLQALLEKNLRARISDEEVSPALPCTIPERPTDLSPSGAALPQVIVKILDSTKYIRTLPDGLQRLATDSWLASLRILFVINLALGVFLLATLLPIEENPLPGSVEEEAAKKLTAAPNGEAQV